MTQISPVENAPAGTRPSSADTKAPLNFIRPQDTKPVFHSAALTGGKQKTFFEDEAHTVAISDMRDIADTLSVDREGFEAGRPNSLDIPCMNEFMRQRSFLPEIVVQQ